MKSKSLLSILSLGLLTLALQSCENQDVEFPDYTNSAVYFAYQNPVRTLVLGEDENFDTSLDNAHQCEIYAVLSGMYSNKGNVTVGIQADNSLCDNLYFADGTAVKAMPSTYYSLAGKIHRSVIGYARCIFHCIACCHLIKVTIGEIVNESFI